MLATPATLPVAEDRTATGPAPSMPGELAPSAPASDYDSVRQAIEFISNEYQRQPSLAEVAEAAGLSPAELEVLFRRWAGLTPKAFLQAVTLDRARKLLSAGASLLDASLDVGLSGPSRLHDLFVKHEAMSPGLYKAKGEGIDLAYGFCPSPFGRAIVVATDRGLAGVGFSDGTEAGDAHALEDMVRRWPKARFRLDEAAVRPYAARSFDPGAWSADRPLRVVFIGSDFEIRVWQTLLRIPVGCAATYSQVAETIGVPKAARAVGAAVGRNPISFVVPCHRVLGKSGALTGYHWGLSRKRAMLGWEAGILART
jgi:AraC family transcriptional regulator of adaptative response/methylated-DNA-[protein]-cysteine methyltransferase